MTTAEAPKGVMLLAARLAFGSALAFTLWSASTAAGQGPDMTPPWDKIVHFGAFYTLTLLAMAALPRLPLLWVALAMVIVGGGIEVVQLVPELGRSSDLKDMLADVLGIAAALAPVAVAKLRRMLANA